MRPSRRLMLSDGSAIGRRDEYPAEGCNSLGTVGRHSVEAEHDYVSPWLATLSAVRHAFVVECNTQD